MITEDMLGALFDALQGVKRFIFVGDPAQLPPIGAGRPFVDIIAKLLPQDYEDRFPRVASGYCELTIERRQAC
jgi:ATP-dependent exoDNAse (exonuclease V) alpha subunit